MSRLSDALLKHRAILSAPKHTDATMEGGMPEWEVQESNISCLLVPETVSNMEGIMGRIPTGRYQCLFQPDVTIKNNWRVEISEITYEVAQAIPFETHLETILTVKSI